MNAERGFRRASLGALLLCAATGAWAQPARSAPPLETGGAWLARCGETIRQASDNGRPWTDAEPCRAWVRGVLDLHAIYQGLGVLDRSDEGFCLRAATTLDRASRIVAMYIEARPASHDVSARMLAYMALREEYPCAARGEPPPG